MKGILTVCMAALLVVASGGNVAGQAARGRAQSAAPAPVAQTSPGAGPVIVFETATKGTFEMETYPNEAPKTVAQILGLVRRNFYNGQRVHRVVPGFVVQWGDPQSRDFTKRELWGTRGSGTEIGVGEMNPKRKHRLGAVAAAHPGDPRRADSQIYVTLAPAPDLDGKYTVFAQVISGMDVVRKLQVGDVIRKATVRDAAPAK